jgi:hypothetical protein
VRSKRIGKDNAAGNCAEIRKQVEATENVVSSEDAQKVDHRESREGIAAAAASQPMNSDSKQTSQNGGSTNEHSQKVSTSKSASHASRPLFRLGISVERACRLPQNPRAQQCS